MLLFFFHLKMCLKCVCVCVFLTAVKPDYHCHQSKVQGRHRRICSRQPWSAHSIHSLHGEAVFVLHLNEASFCEGVHYLSLESHFSRCRVNSSSKAAWTSDSYQCSSTMHHRSELTTFYLFAFLKGNCNAQHMNVHALFTGSCPKLAPKYTCLPLASGHWGFASAAAEGGEICSSPCANGAHPYHQACSFKCCSYTVKYTLYMFDVASGWFYQDLLCSFSILCNNIFYSKLG